MRSFTKLFFILMVGLQLNIFPQIPNSGFENWVGGDPHTPEGWITNNAPPAYTPVSQTPTAYMGSYAVQLQIVNSTVGPIPPFMASDFFPVNQAYGSLTGYYQFQPVAGSEVLYLIVALTENGEIVGAGAIDIRTPAASYTQFSFEIFYTRAVAVPDTAYIWIGITDTTGTIQQAGGYGYVDEISFGPPVGVNPVSSIIPEDYKLKQNYPNPFNPSTKISFSIPEQSYVELIIYDILGNEISKLVSDTYSAGEYSVDFVADNLPAGVYLARLSAGRYSNTIKMTLLK